MGQIHFEIYADSVDELRAQLMSLMPGSPPEVVAPPSDSTPAKPASLEDLIAELQASLGKGYKVVIMEDAEHQRWVEQNAAPAAPKPQTNTPDEPNAVPAAKALADEHGVDLSQITGTGVNGRILKSDVQGYLDSQTAPAAEPEQDRAVLVDVDDTMSDADKMVQAKMLWAHIYGSGEEGMKRTTDMLASMGVKKFHELDVDEADKLLAKAAEALSDLGLDAPAA